MKRIQYLVILLFILFSCQEFELLEHSNPLEDGRPFVSTIKSDFITSTTAELYAEVISIGETKITSFGHCWSTTDTPTIENIYQENENYSNNKYVTNITNLNSSTKYYFRAFSTNSIGIAYGEILTFTTNEAGEPFVKTEGVSNITSTSVTLYGKIEQIGNAPVTEHGHCWSTSSSPTITINDDKTSFGSIGVASFNSNASDLTHNTTYYYRAYATNSFGTVYGSSKSFSTTNGEPTVVTVGESNISATTVDLEGNIMGIGDASVTQYGHCWSTSSIPTISDYKTTLSASGMGYFTSNVTNLTQNTTYYYRAYAINSFGTVYGLEMSLTTSGLWSSIGQFSGVTYNNNAMFVLNSNNVWFVGADVWNWDGNNWNTIGSPSNNNLLAVNGTSINNIWVLDDNNGIFNWNGSSWNEIAPPNISNLRDILVFGNAIVLGGGWEAPIIAISSNSGSSWNVENAPCSGSNCSHGFKDMDGTDIDNIWVATGSTTNNGEQGIYQYNGVSWNHHQLYNIQCLSVINTINGFSTSHGDIGSWNCSALEYINGDWYSMGLPTGASSYWGYTPICAISSNEVWFGSDKIYKYDGANWNEETELIGGEIKIINMLNSNEGFALTGNGKILKR